MITPHGAPRLRPLAVPAGRQRDQLEQEAQRLPGLLINSAAAANAVMLGAGYFTPLPGYMNLAEALHVAEHMHTPSGLLWPVPILHLHDGDQGLKAGARIALRDPGVEGHPVLAVQTIEAVEHLDDEHMELLVGNIFGTLDPAHPGVKTFTGLGRTLLSGPVELLNYSYFEQEFPDTFCTAMQIRDRISQQGWRSVVAFQTRNPMHRAHEELCKMALEQLGADGLLIHMLLGKLKPGDIPARVRDAAIREMVQQYFPPNSVLISGYGFDMLYAGPREAVLHAIFRQNCGCDYLIVGRDHAGVGDYYGPFDAQQVFDQIPAGELKIRIFKADHTAWSRKLGRVVMMRDAPDHSKEDFVLLSGTRVRAMLQSGEELPPEFARPEVARILMEHYREQGGDA